MRIRALDGLRAIAICLVIGCHYEIFARQAGCLPQFGWLGVDIFFVLSGFLITSVLLELKDRTNAFGTFYYRRCLRILPPYLLTLCAIAAIAALAGDYRLLGPIEVVKNLAFLQAFYGLGGLIHQIAHTVEFGFRPLLSYTLPVNYPGLAGPISSCPGIPWARSFGGYFFLFFAPLLLCLMRNKGIIVAVVFLLC